MSPCCFVYHHRSNLVRNCARQSKRATCEWSLCPTAPRISLYYFINIFRPGGRAKEGELERCWWRRWLGIRSRMSRLIQVIMTTPSDLAQTNCSGSCGWGSRLLLAVMTASITMRREPIHHEASLTHRYSKHNKPPSLAGGGQIWTTDDQCRASSRFNARSPAVPLRPPTLRWIALWEDGVGRERDSRHVAVYLQSSLFNEFNLFTK